MRDWEVKIETRFLPPIYSHSIFAKDRLRLGTFDTLDEADAGARVQSKWAAEVPSSINPQPVYVYHADSCEPVSVWVNGRMVR
jgi:hypothetical protein